MKKLQAICLGAFLAGSHPAFALINDGKFESSSELFISVFDEAGQQSYYKDLGLTMEQFLNGQGCFEGKLNDDPVYAPFLGKADLVYNIAAVNPLKKDFSNLETWGYVATSSQGAGIFNPAFNFIDNTKQKIQSYIGALNVDPFSNAPGQAGENRSGKFGPTDLGYHGGGTWGPTLGNSVNGNTEGRPDQELEFFFINNSTGADDAGKATKLGAWTLSGSGQVSYSGTGTTQLCTGNGGGGGNQPPVANAGPAQTVAVGTVVTLNGSGSSDPDNGPQPLSYAWTQEAGPPVTLAGATTAQATFTPAQAGVYGFKLTVSDGQASATAQVTITVETPVPQGPYIRLDVPATWRVGQKQFVKWTTGEVRPNRPVNLLYSKNGVKFTLLKSPANKKGAAGVGWKPIKGNLLKKVTTNGALRACVKPTAKLPKVCDTVNIVVEPKR